MTLRRLSAWPLGRWLGALALTACERESPPAPTPTASATVQVGSPELPGELAPKPSPKIAPPAASAASEEPTAPAAPTAWSIAPSFPADAKGPFFHVTALAAGVFIEPSFDSKKLGYVRNGGRVPVKAETVSKRNCTGGWYAVASGGYICGNLGTTDASHPEVKFAGAKPNLDDVLPYPYARNAKNGTPLYKTVPSREQMERYEPYLLARDEKTSTKTDTKTDTKTEAKSETTPRTVATDPAPRAAEATTPVAAAVAPATAVGAAIADGGLITAPAAADPEPEKPWWQRENSKDRLHEIKLEQLESDADDVLAKRMVTGFYVAVDKTFRWNGRAWYKTTKGLVAPTDRFWQTAGPKFKGLELDGESVKLPLGWVYGGNKSIGTYTLDAESKVLKNAKSYNRFDSLQLTGKSTQVGKTTYLELTDGSWVKRSQVRVTNPGPLPAGLTPNERWVDVNLSSQTLVAYVGERPIYATMISSGKESKIKDKDHRTPVGEWRVREKHITTTMDGDGSAAGDLPYSIEDVPYVMYYHRSFALHGAFWHNNYGVQMSHGCVNLAPLDAKYLFFFADPPIPAGFHGVWSNDGQPGTRVVVHE